MSLLRLAGTGTKKIALDEDGAYVEVLADISKRTFNALISSMPEVDDKGLTIPQAIAFQRELFITFVTGWSLDAPVDDESYQELSRESADVIDSAVAKHFESLTPSTSEGGKSEGPSPANG